MLNPFIPLVEVTFGQAIGILGPFVFGVLSVIALLILLGVQIIKKKRLLATKIVLAAAIVLLAVGVFTLLSSGVLVTEHDHDDERPAASGTDELKAIDFHVGDEIIFSSTDKDGNPVDSSLFKDSKVTFVNCWETWCGACKDELPALQALYEKYHDEGFNIIGIYSDENNLQEVLDNAGVTYPIIRASDGLNAESQMSMPSSFFVDSDGRVLKVPSQIDPNFKGLGTKNNCIVTGGHTAEEWEVMIQYYLLLAS